MVSKFLDGIKFTLGIIFTLFILFGIVYAVGFHSADEILGGTFSGNFVFQDSVTFNGEVNGISAVSVPAGVKLDFNDSICPSGYEKIGSSVSIYSEDLTSGGVATGDPSTQVTYPASAGFDNSIATSWIDYGPAPTWLKYDFGLGNEKIIQKVTINPNKNTVGANVGGVENFEIQGSNDDSSWDFLYSGVCPNVDNSVQTFVFDNSNSYRYYRIYVTSNWRSDEVYVAILNLEMMEKLVTTTKCLKK